MTGHNPTLTCLRAFAALRMRLGPLPLLGIALAGLLVLGGCAGGSNVATDIDSEQVESLDEVAVVSVRTKKVYENELGEKSLENTENVRKAVRTITDVTERQSRRADPNYAAGANRVRDYLFGGFRSAAPFSMVEEGSILQSSAYQAFANQTENWRTSLFATPKGYRSLDPDRLTAKASAQTLIEALPSTPDGLLFAETTYTLVTEDVRRAKGEMWISNIRDGTHARTTLADGDTVQVDVKATVRLRVLNQSGSTVLKVTQTARSDEGFRFVHGQGWTAHQIDASAQNATQKALGNITSRLQNKLPADVLAQTSSVLPTTEGTE